mmetsp:Transcript_87429/g.199761  ORF Transcript_87429/g.199761 Transcript_87429/m.199761 type:complete len:236 (-) Transcript_87429:222-929(-)
MSEDTVQLPLAGTVAYEDAWRRTSLPTIRPSSNPAPCFCISFRRSKLSGSMRTSSINMVPASVRSMRIAPNWNPMGAQPGPDLAAAHTASEMLARVVGGNWLRSRLFGLMVRLYSWTRGVPANGTQLAWQQMASLQVEGSTPPQYGVGATGAVPSGHIQPSQVLCSWQQAVLFIPAIAPSTGAKSDGQVLGSANQAAHRVGSRVQHVVLSSGPQTAVAQKATPSATGTCVSSQEV